MGVGSEVYLPAAAAVLIPPAGCTHNQARGEGTEKMVLKDVVKGGHHQVVSCTGCSSRQEGYFIRAGLVTSFEQEEAMEMTLWNSPVQAFLRQLLLLPSWKPVAV